MNKKLKDGLVSFRYDLQESGLIFPVIIMLITAIIVIVLDIIFWDESSLSNIIAEGNGMLLDLIIVVTFLGYFEYKRNKKNEIFALKRELNLLRRSKSEDDILKKADLIRYIYQKK